MFSTIAEIESAVSQQQVKKKLALAGSDDKQALGAVLEAREKGFVEPILFGQLEKTKILASELGFSLADIECHHVTELVEAVALAVQSVSEGRAHILMKGAAGTADLMKGILNKEWGLRTGSLLSHFALFEIPGYPRLLGMTDVAISIAPTLDEKVRIAKNAIEFLHAIGNECPNVAIIAAVEKVNEAMPATVDAAALVNLFKAGEFGSCRMEGPLAFDNAISKESAAHKGIKSEIAGQTDLVLLPQIESGNVLYKALGFLTESKVAAVVLGAKAPIVLTSRADSHDSKLNSIVLAAIQGREKQ